VFDYDYLKSNFECSPNELHDLLVNLPYETDVRKYEIIFEYATISEIPTRQQKEYLKKLDEKREKWCKSFHKEVRNLGVNTTSRMESFHSNFKRKVKGTKSLCELIYYILCFIEEKSSILINNMISSKKINDIYSKFPLMNQIKSLYSEYVYTKIVESYINSYSFEVKKINNSNHYFLVRPLIEHPETTINLSSITEKKEERNVFVKNNVYFCTCSFSLIYGLPCCHILRVSDIMQEKDVNRLNIDGRWKKVAFLKNNESIKAFMSDYLKLNKRDKSEGYFSYYYFFFLKPFDF